MLVTGLLGLWGFMVAGCPCWVVCCVCCDFSCGLIALVLAILFVGGVGRLLFLFRRVCGCCNLGSCETLWVAVIVCVVLLVFGVWVWCLCMFNDLLLCELGCSCRVIGCICVNSVGHYNDVRFVVGGYYLVY